MKSSQDLQKFYIFAIIAANCNIFAKVSLKSFLIYLILLYWVCPYMNFNDLFRNVIVPVIIFSEDKGMSVVYENHSAAIQLNPLSVGQNWQSLNIGKSVAEVLKLQGNDFEEFCALLKASPDVKGFSTRMTLHSGESLPVSLYANKLEINDAFYFALFIYPAHMDAMYHSHAQALAALMNMVYQSRTTDDAINNALSFSGNYMGVSRSYIFESVSESLTSNTYEWCAEGISPQISELKELPKELYSYNDIIARGLAVTDDVRTLSDEDRAILEPQGIKSLAIIPITYNGESLGYVGLDDCLNYRKWGSGEVQYLQNLADMLASLLIRRDSELNIKYSFDILKTITDNSENFVLVSDINTNKILFANSAFALSVGESPEELPGQFANVVLQSWASNITEHDPLFELIGSDGQTKGGVCYVWEFHNHSNSRWYLMHDSIIKWIDGRDVHLQTSTDITGQKEYEQQLKRVASTDKMTGLYNREWGANLIHQILNNASNDESNSLVFIDIDNLKRTNDTLGHAAGDRLILKTVELITAHIRRSDNLCRWGGDEFLLIVRADEAQTERVMSKIDHVVAEYNENRGDDIAVGFSYGIVGIVPGSDITVDSLISAADKKMYEHKMKADDNGASE